MKSLGAKVKLGTSISLVEKHIINSNRMIARFLTPNSEILLHFGMSQEATPTPLKECDATRKAKC